MKKIIALILLFFFIAIPAVADEVTQTLTFAWEQDDTTNLLEWEMRWGTAAGGPYTQLATIPYNAGDPAGTFQSPVNSTVTGAPATTETRYFVLRACGNIPQQDGTTVYECSEFSNEVSFGFWIPAGQFSVPVQFRIIPQ